MKLYESPMAPNPRRVKIFLAEKGVEVKSINVDLQKGENLVDDFLKKNKPYCIYNFYSLEL